MVEFVKPQLCRRPLGDMTEVYSNYIATEKLDGHRLMLANDGQRVHLWSRTGKPFNLPFAAEVMRQFPGWYLDAEVVVGDPGACQCSSQEKNGSHIVSHYRSAHPEALRIVVFDVLWADGECVMDEPWEVRYQLAAAFIDRVKDARFRLNRVLWPGNGEPDWEGAEGVVYKRLGSPYRPGSRCLDWIKEKAVREIDVVITDADAAPTKWTVRPGHIGTDGIMYPDGKLSSTWPLYESGQCKWLSYGYVKDGEMVRVGSLGWGVPAEDAEAMVGKVAVVKCWGVYADGCLRHPCVQYVRDDKEPEEVTLKAILEAW